jgi:hypothetical protein
VRLIVTVPRNASNTAPTSIRASGRGVIWAPPSKPGARLLLQAYSQTMGFATGGGRLSAVRMPAGGAVAEFSFRRAGCRLLNSSRTLQNISSPASCTGKSTLLNHLSNTSSRW